MKYQRHLGLLLAYCTASPNLFSGISPVVVPPPFISPINRAALISRNLYFYQSIIESASRRAGLAGQNFAGLSGGSYLSLVYLGHNIPHGFRNRFSPYTSIW